MQTNAVRRVPRRRIMDKVDEYMGRRDYAGVERLLLYWLKEAEACRDDDGRRNAKKNPRRAPARRAEPAQRPV